MHQLPDEYLAEALPLAKKIAIAQGVENYNILQNNGRIAHQACFSCARISGLAHFSVGS